MHEVPFKKKQEKLHGEVGRIFEKPKRFCNDNKCFDNINFLNVINIYKIKIFGEVKMTIVKNYITTVKKNEEKQWSTGVLKGLSPAIHRQHQE